MRFSNLVQQIKEVSRPEWFAASALSVAMFSVGFSVSVAACSAQKAEPPGLKPAGTEKIAEVVKPAAPAATPVSSAIAASVAPKASAAPASARHPALAASPLAVKRFVIASAVEAREPVLAESVTVSKRPLFAFAELENAGDYEQKVRVTFELQGESAKGKSVGHVELAVPASSARWRTWAKTQLVDTPGQWAAVLRDEQGRELARTPFEVTL
jgi:hypothetical protein